MTLAFTVEMFFALVAVAASVLAVFSAWRVSNLARTVRSTISLQGELHEIRDYVGKIDKWAKRLNSREAVQLSRERAADSANASKQSLTRVSGPEDKDELRRRAGLVAGQPARHN